MLHFLIPSTPSPMSKGAEALDLANLERIEDLAGDENLDDLENLQPVAELAISESAAQAATQSLQNNNAELETARHGRAAKADAQILKEMKS